MLSVDGDADAAVETRNSNWMEKIQAVGSSEREIVQQLCAKQYVAR